MSSRHSLTEETLIAYVEYLVDSIYVCVGNRIYRQCVGIPMGTDCAPLLANLFLFYYEYNYMKNLIKQDIWAARRFNKTARYNDDSLTLNNSRFEYAIDNIYPQELQLKKTNKWLCVVCTHYTAGSDRGAVRMLVLCSSLWFFAGVSIAVH